LEQVMLKSFGYKDEEWKAWLSSRCAVVLGF
jgi:hypothetical protein